MLLDHFHPPLSECRNGTVFLNVWAVQIATALNEVLPTEWFAEPDLYGDYHAVTVRIDGVSKSGGVVTLVVLADPTDKANERKRKKFISLNRGWIEVGAGVIVVDIVTRPVADLHADIHRRLQPEATIPKSAIYSASYHHVGKRFHDPDFEIWHVALTIGSLLPTMPLYLNDGPLMPVDLQTTYEQALKAVRIES